MTREEAVGTIRTLLKVRGKGEWSVNNVDVRKALEKLIPELKGPNKANYFNEEDILA